MTNTATARALKLIGEQLPRILDRLDREKLADQILGVIQSEFLIAPWPNETEVDAARSDLAAMDVPGLRGSS